MSARAINWALDQRGLKPAAKLVLVCLADRHNKDTGACFPSQATLAEDACISRSSLNDQLDTLEALGFFTREPVIDPTTKRQKATQYHLHIGHSVSEIHTRGEAKAVSENGQKPCPKKTESRVRNSDTNQENLTKDRTKIEDESAQAFGEDFFSELGRLVGDDLITASGRIEAKKWAGVLSEPLILQAVAEVSARTKVRRIRSLKYFTGTILALAAEAHAAPEACAIRSSKTQPKPPRDYDAMMRAAMQRLGEAKGYPQ